MAPQTREWHKTVNSQAYLISTSRSLVQIPFFQRIFADPGMYWANVFGEEDMKTMLDNSCTLGLYKISPSSSSAASSAATSGSSSSNPQLGSDSQSTPTTRHQETTPAYEQVGVGRLITDYVTFAWLTDVYILPECQGVGLGKWLVACLREVIAAIPQLRRAALLTGQSRSITFYERELGFEVHENGKDGLVYMMGKPKPRE